MKKDVQHRLKLSDGTLTGIYNIVLWREHYKTFPIDCLDGQGTKLMRSNPPKVKICFKSDSNRLLIDFFDPISADRSTRRNDSILIRTIYIKNSSILIKISSILIENGWIWSKRVKFDRLFRYKLSFWIKIDFFNLKIDFFDLKIDFFDLKIDFFDLLIDILISKSIF